MNGVPVQGSKYWLTDRLRGQYGFKGYVVSDSDAVIYMANKHRTASTYKEAIKQAVMAGLNVRCTFRSPDSFIVPLRELVMEGQIPVEQIDSLVRDILRIKFIVGIFDHPYVEDLEEADRLVCCDDYKKVALRASRESVVLLKNEKLLPLSRDRV